MPRLILGTADKSPGNHAVAPTEEEKPC
jgi:hypothetical protein